MGQIAAAEESGQLREMHEAVLVAKEAKLKFSEYRALQERVDAIANAHHWLRIAYEKCTVGTLRLAIEAAKEANLDECEYAQALRLLEQVSQDLAENENWCQTKASLNLLEQIKTQAKAINRDDLEGLQ